MGSHSKLLGQVESMLNLVGGDEGLRRLQRQESRLITVRHHDWMRKIWERHGEALGALGAYCVKDPWDDPSRNIIRDVVLPCECKFSEKEAWEMLLERHWNYKCKFSLAEKAQERPLREKIEKRDLLGNAVSLYFTKSLLEERKKYLAQYDVSGDEPFSFWRANTYFPGGQNSKLHNNSLDREGLLNFYLKYFPVIAEDACFTEPLLQGISSGSIPNYDFKNSAGFSFSREGGLLLFTLDQWDVEWGFADNKTPGIIIQIKQ